MCLGRVQCTSIYQLIQKSSANIIGNLLFPFGLTTDFLFCVQMALNHPGSPGISVQPDKYLNIFINISEPPGIVVFSIMYYYVGV